MNIKVLKFLQKSALYSINQNYYCIPYRISRNKNKNSLFIVKNKKKALPIQTSAHLKIYFNSIILKHNENLKDSPINAQQQS